MENVQSIETRVSKKAFDRIFSAVIPCQRTIEEKGPTIRLMSRDERGLKELVLRCDFRMEEVIVNPFEGKGKQ